MRSSDHQQAPSSSLGNYRDSVIFHRGLAKYPKIPHYTYSIIKEVSSTKRFSGAGFPKGNTSETDLAPNQTTWSWRQLPSQNLEMFWLAPNLFEQEGQHGTRGAVSTTVLTI
jgi:hypothetical protein